jgi:thiamine biosynthesis lipoprotein ApbE
MRRRDLLAVAGAPMIQRAAQIHVRQFENVLGTSMELRLDSPAPELAEAAALAEIDRLAAILSSYDSGSEFSRWARTHGSAVRVSPELLEVLGLYDYWRVRTGGAVSASLAVAGAGADWRLDRANGTATHLSAAPLVLNSFTKSYVINKAADAAMRFASGVVVNIGGDLVVKGRTAEPAHVANPLDDTENSAPLGGIRVQGMAVATSGNSRRGAHIVDPRTGARPDHIASATVVAPRATDAGALATAFTVLRLEESQALAARTPGVEYLLVKKGGAIVSSPGFLLAPHAQVPAVEVIVNFELARIDNQRYRRPYVAVWVEDKDRFPVRTVGLWFQKDRWLPDLRGWYRGDRLRLLAEGNEIAPTISSATRPAGKYTMKWDGRDNKGAAVKPGKYTVYIEAVREHGSYDLLKQEIDLTGGSKQYSLAGGTEIAGASIEYRKAAGH